MSSISRVWLGDACFLLFEKLINAVHQAAPQARIAFNTNPADTAEAVARWVGGEAV